METKLERVVIEGKATPPLPEGTVLPDRMTVPQIVAVTGVKRQTVKSWRERGVLVPVEEFRCNGRTVAIYRGKDVMAMLEQEKRLRKHRVPVTTRTRVYDVEP